MPPHHVGRLTTAFPENAYQVFADDAHGQQSQAGVDVDQQEQAGPPWHAALIDEVQDEIDSAQKEADERDADTDDGYQLQRQRAEIEDVVEGGPHEAQQAVSRSAVLARVVA